MYSHSPRSSVSQKVRSHQNVKITGWCLNCDFLVNDNNELAGRADLLLVRMCGVTPPRSLISPMLDSIFGAIQTSPVGSNEYAADESHP